MTFCAFFSEWIFGVSENTHNQHVALIFRLLAALPSHNNTAFRSVIIFRPFGRMYSHKNLLQGNNCIKKIIAWLTPQSFHTFPLFFFHFSTPISMTCGSELIIIEALKGLGGAGGQKL
jgi:hypothetical protein